MNKEVEDIIQQGKEAIVQLALKLIGGGVTADNFKNIRIKASSKEICVSLLTPIKYLPKNSAYYSDMEALLIEKGTTYHNYSNPKRYNEALMDLPFYKETEEGKKHIQFVIESINKRAPFDVSKFEESMIIRNDTDFYNINIESEYYHLWYKVEKLTGKIFDEGHAHFIQPPTLKTDYQEVFTETNNS